MPAPYGVTPTGFSCPTEEELLALIEADQRADISETLDLSENSVIGQVNRIFAKRTHEAWLALESSYHGFDPDRAEGDQLTSLSKITGAARVGAYSSQVDVTLELQAGTELEAGTHFVHEEGHPDVRFTPLANHMAAEDETVTLRFRAEQTGPVDVPVNELTVIATPVVGWTRVVSSGEVTVGHVADDDEALRIRREATVARAGSGTLAGLRADLSAIDGASSVQIFENFTDYTDARGIPPHSFEAVVSAPNATDDQIAQAILDGRLGGVSSHGSSSGTALDKDGKPHVERFTRPAVVEAWLTFTLTSRAGYVGADAFRQTVATRLDAAIGAGQPLGKWDAFEAAHGLGGKVTSVLFGTAPSPTSDAEIAVTTEQHLRFDAGRIVVIE